MCDIREVVKIVIVYGPLNQKDFENMLTHFCAWNSVLNDTFHKFQQFLPEKISKMELIVAAFIKISDTVISNPT